MRKYKIISWKYKILATFIFIEHKCCKCGGDINTHSIEGQLQSSYHNTRCSNCGYIEHQECGNLASVGKAHLYKGK